MNRPAFFERGDFLKHDKIMVKTLIEETTAAMERAGFSRQSLWGCIYGRFRTIQKLHDEAGKEYFDPGIVDEYLQRQRNRYENGEIGKYTFYAAKSIIRYLCGYYEKGYIIPPRSAMRMRYIPNDNNRKVLEQFLSSREFESEKARNDFSWAVRKYMCYFEQKGIHSLADVTIADVQTFIKETAEQTTGGTMHDLMCYLRQFHLFLRETNIVSVPDCVDLMSFTVVRESRIQDYITDEELDGILGAIEVDTDQGLRDRALFILASETGLRGCDVIRLQLSDIDWRRGEIRVQQKKTGRDLALPLMPASGDAIKEYILNARPNIDSDILFLSVSPPYRPIKDAAHLTDLIKKYQKKAGIVRSAQDGKGFHGLRRRLAYNMVTTGTPITTIAQVLGHANMNTVEKYLSFDEENLKECALDFSGITMKGGV